MWSGGVVKSRFPDLAKEISKERIKEAVESEVDILTKSCPFCIGNLIEGCEEFSSETQRGIKLINIIDLIVLMI